MACTIVVFCVATAIASPAQTFKSLFSFDGSNGVDPSGSFVQGIDGNLYGTTWGGGAYNDCYAGNVPFGCGTAFKITPSGTFTLLHNFDGSEGGGPISTLLLATDGNFYGDAGNEGANGVGTIFKMTPAGTVTVLASLDGADGAYPGGQLLEATNGNFIGPTAWGGSGGGGIDGGYGVDYQITPEGKITDLHSFDGTDGWNPYDAGLIQATNGDLYGVMVWGVKSGCYNGCGEVFRLTLSGAFTTLYGFCSQTNCADGDNPSGTLVQASDGNLYGTTLNGGANNAGTVFKITPGGKLTTLYSFCAQTSCADGANPSTGLIQATDGNFYGTTVNGGTNGDGVVFKITAGGTFNVLHSFDGTDGANPYSGLFQATNGTFYGVTSVGGTDNDGAVYSLSTGLGPFVILRRDYGKVGQTWGILGQRFTGTTAVSFNGTPATFTAVSDTYLTATVPAGATTGFVTVTEPSGTLTSNKVFRVLPQILSFSPTSGPVGTPVVITGNSFTGATVVTFDCEWQTTFTVDSDTQITAIVPANATVGKIAVRTPGGSIESTQIFTVTP